MRGESAFRFAGNCFRTAAVGVCLVLASSLASSLAQTATPNPAAEARKGTSAAAGEGGNPDILLPVPVEEAPRRPITEAADASYQSSLSEHLDESIDPYMGALTLRNVDLFLPGNGGFDISLVRTYSSGRVAREHRTELDPYTPKPLGWTLHFGRLLVRYRDCSGSAASSSYMPTLEMPDGSRRTVWAVAQSGMPAMMTTDRWSVVCAGAGYVVTSPEGLRYEMQHRASVGTTVCPNPFHPDQPCGLTVYATTRISDPRDNWASIQYENTIAGGEPEIMGLVTSDGRSLSFEYTSYGEDPETIRRYITSVTSDSGRTVHYTYRVLGQSGGVNIVGLVQFVDAAGNAWSYDYHLPKSFTNFRCRFQNICPPEPQDLLLSRVTSPAGGVRSYTWTDTPSHFDGESELRPAAVATKISSDGGNWSFAYDLDRAALKWITTVNGPSGRRIYHHRSEGIYRNAINADFPSPWASGVLLYQEDEGVQSVTYAWKGQRISSDWNSLLELSAQSQFMATKPVLVERKIVRDGASYITQYANFDAFGNPGRLTELGPAGGGRTTTVTYLNDVDKWIVGRIKDEVRFGAETRRIFDAFGSVVSHAVDGVSTTYTYDAEGNIKSKTLPRGLVHEYSSYKRGVAQVEVQPEGITLSRIVSAAGTVTSETDGEGKVTAYAYDGLGRVVEVRYPVGNPRSIVYTASEMTSTRGGIEESTRYDGFGRPISISIAGIKTDMFRDALGRKTFVSNPNAAIGTAYQYDILDRITKITNSDGTYQSHAYGGGAHTIVDEREKSTTYTYKSYGDPGRRFLMAIAAPEPSASLTIGRNERDLITSVTQGGLTRTYTYDDRNYLVFASNPETGLTSFGRDIAGNMINKKVGGSATTLYTYDQQNRLASIVYPGSTPMVRYTYDRRSKLLSALVSGADRRFSYDDNGNLVEESLTVDGQILKASYAYNSNDQLSSMTYPRSRRVVAYAPDAVGRPTRVAGFASSISYWPSGLIKQIDYANGTRSMYGQHMRLWPESFSTHRSDGSQLIGSSYTYDGSGNLKNISDSVDASYNRAMSYDDIGRLVSASGPWGIGAIVYGGNGNIISQVFGAYQLSYSYDLANRLSSISGSRSGVFGYDYYGNVTGGTGSAYTFDDVPNLRCVNCGMGAAYEIRYGYDGLNQRASVQKAGVTSYEMYDSNGRQLVEFVPSQGNKLVEHIYLGNKRIASVVSSEVQVVTATLSQSIASTVAGQSYRVTWGSAGAVSCRVDFSRNGEPPVVYATTLSGAADVVQEVVGVYAWRNICTSATGTTHQAGFTHQVTAPASSIAVLVSAASQAYPGVYLGEAVSTLSYSYRNDGAAAMTLSSPALAAPLSVASNNCSAVAKAGTCTIVISRATNVAGLNQSQSFTPAGAGTAPAAATASWSVYSVIARWGSTALTFPSTAVGNSSVQTVQLSNMGNWSTNWSAPDSVANVPAGYVFDTSGCANVVAGGSCSVTVRFTPPAAATFAGNNIYMRRQNGIANTLSVSGLGTASSVAVLTSAAAQTFPAVYLGGAVHQLSFSYRNDGSAMMTLATPTFAAPLSVTSNNCVNVAVGGSCAIVVSRSTNLAGLTLSQSFTPSGAGSGPATATATWSVYSVIPRWESESLGFGTVIVGAVLTKGVSLYNDGNYPIDWATNNALDNVPAAFTFDTRACSNVVAGGSCSVQVTFAPTAAVSYGGGGITMHVRNANSNGLTVAGLGQAATVQRFSFVQASSVVGVADIVATFEFRNDNAAATSVTAVELEGTSDPGYAVVGRASTCVLNGLVAAGATCKIVAEVRRGCGNAVVNAKLSNSAGPVSGNTVAVPKKAGTCDAVVEPPGE